MEENSQLFDCIVIGSGMGGMSAASLLASDGYEPLVIEAAKALGGCSSSYTRKGYIFESGATTLIGFDEHQPLRKLEKQLGISLPKVPIEPSMQVHFDDKTITRYQNRDKWIAESIKHFGEEEAQKEFWSLAFRVADIVWKVSGTNPFFPPSGIIEWLHLLKNDPRDVWVLPYALESVQDIARHKGISNQKFYRFLDEQLMISAQAESGQTPFLFGAPAVTYTNATNYSVPGGLVQMVETLRDFIHQQGGSVRNKEKVVHLDRKDSVFQITTVKAGKTHRYRSRSVISNIPVWNMPDITNGELQKYFSPKSAQYNKAWGAFTMGIAIKDTFGPEFPLHHQIHTARVDSIEGLNSGSIFVSLSHADDKKRSPGELRTLNVSTHSNPEYWFSLNGSYDAVKDSVENQILNILDKKLPGFKTENIDVAFSSTPVTWSNWVYRKKGRVGGIPQQMDRSLLDWTPAKTPFKGLYLAGDTVFPGQGIPGVTLSGINVYCRVKKYLNQT